jgi:hypothetical protein
MPRGRPIFEPTEKQRGQVEAMLRYGISQEETAKALGINEKTLAKHFREEIETGSTKANAQVGEFIFSTIIGLSIPGRPPVTDQRARAILGMFWAKTRMGWKDTTIHRHEGKDGGPIEVALVRERNLDLIEAVARRKTGAADPAATPAGDAKAD